MIIGIGRPRSGKGDIARVDHGAPRVVNKRNPHEKSKPKNLRIATWKGKSMFMAGKVYNAIQEMERIQIDILGIGEMQWPGTGKCTVGDYLVYYAGGDDPNHWNRVGIIVHKRF